ncbi:sulfite exporter TauE/SafE family protein [Paenibacillus sp. TRM 82003]|uniref:sulfite exporter TauE/SafE family protein n=1 Tax=Kineococcus sp. TRM81007 TaxID=2925831 RepID=UPI001F5798D5|nr:sulfite exporter TauE/SafE family protein [Kineococcus sp. TRM81007]MCI2237412.1 sulfite exporter TauE/SafE family protein [Kineococcus sp. TRM81007]MCI3919763.1 sulfite exporter TauE/SafE family protein [Paenibacillus sp. TRM 82003]
MSTTGLVLLLVAALVVGFAKTAVGGAATVAVAIFATVLPAKESTGAILPLLIVGDLFALAAYRRHADWSLLLRLLPSVVVGVLLGAWFIDVVGDTLMRRSIGAVILLLVGLHLLRRHRLRRSGGDLVPASPGRRHLVAATFGSLAGFCTMVANAGGAPMSIYLFTMGLGVMSFLGTGAWFFFILNVFKLPFSAGLGLITAESLRLDLLLVPAVVAGALLGRWVVGRLNRDRFENVVLGASALSALNLLH